MDWQRGQDTEMKKDDVAAETFGNLITSSSGVQSIKVSTGGKAIPKLKLSGESTATTERSNYAKTLHKIDGILSQKQHNDDTFVDDISDYEYEDVPEEVEAQTVMKVKAKATASSSRLQFGKSLNGNLRRAGKTVVRPSFSPSRMSELELEFKESSDSIELTSDTEASSITPVIDDYNQTDSSTTSTRQVDGKEDSTMLTTLSGSDNDDIVEIDTSSTPSTERALSSTIDVIENDFEIKKKQKKKQQQQQLQTELEQKPVVDDNNNERDLADNYKGNNSNNNDSNEGQSEPPPQSINQTVAELMLSDAAHFDDNDDIDIVKLGGAGANNQSNEVDLYKTAAAKQAEPKATKLPPPASENEVLKEEEQLDKVAHLTPLKPYVSERYDRPSKRILVNVTIATDDDSDSVYTLHVAVPTGGGSRDVEQMLTHEKKRTKQLPDEDNNIDSLGACVPEPPPRMPDCPCSCLPPPPPIIFDDLPHAAMSMTPQEAVEKDEPLSSTTNLPSTVFDNNNNNIVTTTDTITVSASDNDNVIDTITDRAACPDVMPILILEGDCTVSAPANPTSTASD